MKSLIKSSFFILLLTAVFNIGVSNATAVNLKASKTETATNIIGSDRQNPVREEGCKITIQVSSDGKVVVKITCKI